MTFAQAFFTYLAIIIVAVSLFGLYFDLAESWQGPGARVASETIYAGQSQAEAQR